MLDFNKIIEEEEPVKKQKLIKTVLEPGHKIPLANYKCIGQWCDKCEDIEMHAYSKSTNKIRCITCGETTQLK